MRELRHTVGGIISLARLEFPWVNFYPRDRDLAMPATSMWRVSTSLRLPGADVSDGSLSASGRRALAKIAWLETVRWLARSENGASDAAVSAVEASMLVVSW